MTKENQTIDVTNDEDVVAYRVVAYRHDLPRLLPRKITIHNTVGESLYTAEAESLGDCVQEAARGEKNLTGAALSNAELPNRDLSGARMRGADLRGANLQGVQFRHALLLDANLSHSDLQQAGLSKCNLYGARLIEANLCEADLNHAELTCADLSGADLRGANLHGAIFDRTDLRGVRVNWRSHNLIGAILRNAAGSDANDRTVRQRRAFAGLVATSTDWCWSVWVQMAEWHRVEAEWAISVLRPYVRDSADEQAPPMLRR
jgi:uncharacterized protein YjbI with pentapeptide repeats